MRAPHSYPAIFPGLAAILTLGCGDSTGPATPTLGAIQISVSTASANIDDVDPDGYTLSIDGRPGQTLGVNATLTIGALPEGRHLVRLDGLASNCSVSGPNPLSVDVIGGKPASPVSFAVSCSARIESGYGGWDY